MNSPASAARRGAVALGLLGALAGSLGAATASAVPVAVTLNYVCTFPLIRPQPLQLKITSDIPATVPTNTLTNAFQISATAAVSTDAATGIRAVEATSLEGTALASSTVTLPSGKVLNIQVPTTIPSTPIPATGGFSTTASGETPELTFPTAGVVPITVGDVVLTLTPRLADGTVSGLDTFETECKQVAGQDNVLARITVVNPGGTPTPTPPISSPSPSPTPGLGVPYSYNIAGSATLKNLVTGSVPLSGGIDARLVLSTGAFTGNLSLNQSTAKLTALNFLPVVAKVAIVPTSPVTGTFKAPNLTANAKVRIKLPSVTLFGLQLAGGSGCQTKAISDIALSSKSFDALTGGTLAGSFAIGDLVNCGALTGIVSPLTAGKGNAIALKLTSQTA